MQPLNSTASRPSATNGVPLPDVFQAVGGDPYAQEGGLDLKDFTFTLWQGKWWIVAALMLVTSAAAAWVATEAPEYQAYTLLLVTSEQGGLTAAGLGIEEAFGMQDRTLQNEIMVIQQSLALAEAVAEEMQLIRTLPDSEEMLPALVGDEGRVLPTFALAQRLGSIIQVRAEGREVDALRITARSTNKHESALIANLFASEYIKRTQETSRARVTASRVFLEDQEASRRQQLREVEDQVRTYMTRSGAIALDEEASATVSQIAQLEASRDEARIGLGMRRATLETLESDMADLEPRLVERVSSSVEADLERTQTELVAAEFQLEETFAANPVLRSDPSMNDNTRRLVERIARLKERNDELAREYTREVLAIGVDVSSEGGGLNYLTQRREQIAQERIAISGLEARIGAINDRLRTLEAKLQTIPTQAIELAQLQRARQSIERLYVYIVEKLQEARIAEKSETGYAEVIRPALTPVRPVYPNKSRMFAIAILTGLMLGGGIVLLRKNLDTKIHTPADLRELGQTVLGVIPDMRSKIKEDFGGREFIEVEGMMVGTTASVLLDPMSSTTEAYRRLRANIQLSRPDALMQTLLVTSSEMSEGKTTTVVNLSLAMAQASRRVCLVDCDLRRPRLHKYLGQDRDPGLSELLFAQDEYFDPEAYALPIDDLYLIPAGSKVPNPAEVLGSKRMREFVAMLRKHYDIILFDTPPLLAFSEAMLLSTQCDGVVLVSTADKSERDACIHSMEMLHGVGAPVLGGVLNGVDTGKQQGYGYGYYKHWYGYRYYGTDYYN